MSPSRGLAAILGNSCAHQLIRPCQSRAFTIRQCLQSGHNRWSKIKHDKGKADAHKNKQRSIFAQEITTASRLFGGDPNSNPRLADLITKAKKEGFAKTSIEAAIARGQGRSLDGASLENVTVEGMLKDQIAVIVECETDSKLRTLSAVRLAIKDFGFGTTTPTSYLFTRKGIITFEKDDRVGLDEAFDAALTGGALDLDEDEHGRVVVFTEPGDVRAAGDAISKALDLQIVTSDILWAPNPETKVRLKDETSALELINFADQLREMEPSVQSISINILHDKLQVSDEIWGELQARFNTG